MGTCDDIDPETMRRCALLRPHTLNHMCIKEETDQGLVVYQWEPLPPTEGTWDEPDVSDVPLSPEAEAQLEQGIQDVKDGKVESINWDEFPPPKREHKPGLDLGCGRYMCWRCMFAVMLGRKEKA